MIQVLIYRLVIGLYVTGVRISSLFNPKARLFVKGRRGLLVKIRQQLEKESRPRIWVHCASLGEFEQGRPVIEELCSKYPAYAIVLTFFSPSGYEVRKDYGGADHIFYLPVDTGRNASRFLNIVKPSLCLFIKYELWYGYLWGIATRKIPALLVSAIFYERQGFFKWYGGMQRKMLRCFSHIFVQDERSRQLLQRLDITNVSVSGDTRFDRVIAAASQVINLPQVKAFKGNYKLLVAGSTWGEDEELLHDTLKKLDTNWRLVLVPHEVHESHINEIAGRFGDSMVKWSEWDGSSTAKRVLVVDKVGFLLKLYSYADVAYIGGGFGKDGVHNVLEAAVYGVPCFYGPVIDRFREAVELTETSGAQVVENAESLATGMNKYADEQERRKAGNAAREYVVHGGGATERVMDKVSKYITNNAAKDA